MQNLKNKSKFLPKNENFITYLSRELKISLEEAKLLEKEIRNYSLYKQQLEEIDVKKAITTGAMVASSFLPTSKDATSNYFNLTSTIGDKKNLVNLPIEEQIKVYQNALDHLQKGDAERYRIQKIIDNLKKKLKKEKMLRIQKRQQLEEISFGDIKKGVTKLAGALAISMALLPMAQNLYGVDSCSIDSSGEVVFCNADKLKANRPVKTLLTTIKSAIETTKTNMNSDPSYKDFVKDELTLAIEGLVELSKRKDATPEEKKDIENELKKVIKLKKSIK